MKHTLPKLNLILIAVSFAIIVLGFALMVGAPSGEVYHPDIFSFRRANDCIVRLCDYDFCNIVPP